MNVNSLRGHNREFAPARNRNTDSGNPEPAAIHLLLNIHDWGEQLSESGSLRWRVYEEAAD